jgi:Calx-beta domain
MIVLSSSRFTAAEGSFLRFAVLRKGDKHLLEKVVVATFPGQARPGIDYEHLQKEIQFEPGQRQIDMEIKILNDGQPEFTETFEIRLFQCPQVYPFPAGELGEPNFATVEILDMDT